MRWLLLFAFVPAMFGQLDSDTITVTSSRILNTAVDQIQVTVGVNTGADATLDDVLSALKETGITSTNFSQLLSASPNPPLIGHSLWTFALTEPLSKMPDTLAALAHLQKNRSDIHLDYLVSTAFTQSGDCAWPSLVSHAQNQAQNLAAAAGVKVGPIVSLSEGVQPPGVTAVFLSGYSVFGVPGIRQGDFSQLVSAYGATPIAVPNPWFQTAPLLSPTLSCTLTVQFKLIR